MYRRNEGSWISHEYESWRLSVSEAKNWAKKLPHSDNTTNVQTETHLHDTTLSLRPWGAVLYHLGTLLVVLLDLEQPRALYQTFDHEILYLPGE